MIRIEQEEVHFPADQEDDNLSLDLPSSSSSSRGLVEPAAAPATLVEACGEATALTLPWYSNPLQVTAMLSNFSTSYNAVNISLVLPILEQLHSHTSETDAAAVASSLLAGMIVGQLIGGFLGDTRLGRLGALRAVMVLQIFASLGSAFAISEAYGLYVQLAAWRFVLGVGAGGVYPLAAVLSAEQGGTGHDKNAIADEASLHRVVLTFSTQGLGFVAVPLVTVPLLYTVDNLNVVWRIVLALGSLPGILLLLLQWRQHHQHNGGGDRRAVPLHEPGRNAIQDEGNNEDSDGEIGTILDSVVDGVETEGVFRAEIAQEEQSHARHGWSEAIRHEERLFQKLLGTAATWFLFDVLFYGNTLFQPIVIEAAFGAREHSNPLHLLQRTAVNSLILTSIALPGYAVAGLVMGKRTWGIVQTPRFVMLQGFAAMSVLYLIIGIYWKDLRHYPLLLVFLYGSTFFFANYGPNTTTFVLPSLVYSEECRSTLNGISAAAGKFGALVGATLFAPAADSFGDAAIMLICSFIAVLAFMMTTFFVRLRVEHTSDGVV